MKKILVILVLLTSFGPRFAFADASLPPAWPQGTIYYTLPGGINFVTPWSAAIIAQGYDFIGKEAITQGYVPLIDWWKITAVLGAGINTSLEGSPLAGGIVNLANTQIGTNADVHLALTGGYNINEHHAMAVLSASLQFLQ